MRDGEPLLQLKLDVAEDEAARVQGLRGRTLREDEALVLWFFAPSEVCIENTGVEFAIDAAYVNEGRVVVVESFEPDEASLHCHRADRVVEAQRGVLSALEPGDEAVFAR
ncbi:MAG: DUF192 domain-containing protein [Myxococcota bacterium]